MHRSKRPTAALTIAALTGALLLFGASPAHAAEFDVCATGGTHTTIQDAVDAASAGATITVCAGTYAESVTVDKSLMILGPNASISPNTSDPLVQNPARVAEAIITPPGPSGNHAFNLESAASTVSISGFTVDMQNSNWRNRFVSADGVQDLNLTLTHNILRNLRQGDGGYVYVMSGTGDRSLTVTGNRFTGGQSSNGVRVASGGAHAGNATVTITDNVWLDNASWAIHLSSPAVGKHVTGVVKNNWIGNSTPGVEGVNGFSNRQAGILLARHSENLLIEHNTFKNIEHAAFNIYYGFTGKATLAHNTIDGYNNVDSANGGVLVVRPFSNDGGPGPTEVGDLLVTHNVFQHAVGDSRIIRKDLGTGVLDARLNWWGQEEGPLSHQIADWGHAPINDETEVLFDPWLAESTATAFGSEVIDPNTTVKFRDRDNSPLLTGDPEIDVSAATFTGSGESWIEARSLQPGDLPAGATPFSLNGAVLLDLELMHETGTSSTGPYTVCIAGDPNHKLWHYESGAWVDITNRELGGATLPVIPGKVCGMVNDFSPFALAGAGLAATGASVSPIIIGTGGMLVLAGLALMFAIRRERVTN